MSQHLGLWFYLTNLIILFVDPAPSSVDPAPSSVDPAPSSVDPAPSSVDPAPSSLSKFKIVVSGLSMLGLVTGGILKTELELPEINDGYKAIETKSIYEEKQPDQSNYGQSMSRENHVVPRSLVPYAARPRKMHHKPSRPSPYVSGIMHQGYRPNQKVDQR